MITVLGNRVTRSDLHSVDVVRPETAGSRWAPVQHGKLADTLASNLLDRGIVIQNEVWAVDASGQDLVGGIDVRLPESLGIEPITGSLYSMALRHSNRQKFALTISCGLRVMVCQNGVLTGEWVMRRRHTTGLDLGSEIDRGVDRFVEEARSAGQAVEQLRERSLTNRETDHLLMEAGRRKLMPFSHVGLVWKRYQSPESEDWLARNAWSLLNSFNEVVKRQSPVRQLTALDGFRTLLLERN